MKTITIISDLTGKILSEGVIHIQKTFWYGSPFDMGELSIDTSKAELEELFGCKINRETTKRGFCSLCHADLVSPVIREPDGLYGNGISGFIEQLQNQVLTTEFQDENGNYEFDLCETCWTKHFEKYIRFYDGDED